MSEKQKKTVAKRPRGRPRKDRHLCDFADLGDPPCADLLDLAEWVHRVVGTVAWQVARGRGGEDVQAGIRGLAVALGKLLPAGIAGQGVELHASEIDPSQPPPAEDPLARSVWMIRVLAMEIAATMRGETTSSERRALCATASALAQVLPPDVYHEARQKLRAARASDTFSRRKREPQALPEGRPAPLRAV